MKLSTRLRRLALVLPVLWSAERVQADDGIPALLQFAEQYSSSNKLVPEPHSVRAPVAAAAQTPSSDSLALRRALKERDVVLAKQQAALRAKENALAEETSLRIQAEQAVKALGKMPEGVSLRKVVNGLRDAVSGMSDERRMNAQLTLLQESARRDRVALKEEQDKVEALNEQIVVLNRKLKVGEDKKVNEQQPMEAQLQSLQLKFKEKSDVVMQQQEQLGAEQIKYNALKAEFKALKDNQKMLRTALTDRLQKENDALSEQLISREQQLKTLEKRAQDLQLVTEQKEASLSALQQENSTLQQQRTVLTEQVSLSKTKQASQSKILHQLQKDAEALHAREKWLAKPQLLDKPELQQAYAAGDALGRDILTILSERKAWGINTDQQTVLAGVVDAFSGQHQLSPDLLNRALADSEQVVNIAREKMIVSQQKKGEVFVADFKKQPGVKQSSSGFWYRVEYSGDTPLHDEDIVDVVVKEMLTDGTVIQDMSLTENVLSQPLSAYPPLFREAIGFINNHGSLTMVVPAALAYGDKGYPPKVPPNATMVYELRIDNSKAMPIKSGL